MPIWMVPSQAWSTPPTPVKKQATCKESSRTIRQTELYWQPLQRILHIAPGIWLDPLLLVITIRSLPMALDRPHLIECIAIQDLQDMHTRIVTLPIPMLHNLITPLERLYPAHLLTISDLILQYRMIILPRASLLLHHTPGL